MPFNRFFMSCGRKATGLVLSWVLHPACWYSVDVVKGDNGNNRSRPLVSSLCEGVIHDIIMHDHIHTSYIVNIIQRNFWTEVIAPQPSSNRTLVFLILCTTRVNVCFLPAHHCLNSTSQVFWPICRFFSSIYAGLKSCGCSFYFNYGNLLQLDNINGIIQFLYWVCF